MHASKALQEVTGPHWESQALMKTRGFEILKVSSNSHASAFRHLSKWQMNRHFLEETNETPFEDKGALKKSWALCLWFICELTDVAEPAELPLHSPTYYHCPMICSCLREEMWRTTSEPELNPRTHMIKAENQPP